MNQYLIWSFEHKAWWKPNRMGYTTDPKNAGRYPKTEACSILEDANLFNINEKMVNENDIHTR